jgi:hypothetical protein
MNLATHEAFELQIHEHDPRLREVFKIAGSGKFSERDLALIASHTYTLYALGPAGSLESARSAMAVACGLLRAGGLAVKVESAGVAHTAEHWFRFSETAGPLPLYGAYVTLIGGGGTVYSCGMHNLGLRDGIVSGNISPKEATGLLQTFLLYTLLETPVLEHGHTFSVDAQAPRYRLEAETCSKYAPDRAFHNPFGMWRLCPVEGHQG